MREAWRLPTPDLIISVTGGAKHFELQGRLRKTFQLGLVSVAATTSKFDLTFSVYITNNIF
jgi:transient receptor potential cation channel subfamily M protein 2